MERFPHILNALGPRKVLVAGDLLLDRYTFGNAKRVSPEAPVLVLQVESEEDRPGGSGNVLLNLISLTAQVVPLGRVGKDRSGKILTEALEKEGMDISFVIEEEGFHTPTKNRLIAERQQLVRVDHERNAPLSKEAEKKLLSLIPEAIADCDAIALSDYGKGFLSDRLIAALIEAGRQRNIPIIVDPKGKNYQKYKGCSLIKPNKKEAIEASRLALDVAIEEHGEALLKLVEAEHLLITLGDEGSVLFEKNKPCRHFKVAKREVRDVTGAGDTVLAALTLGIACSLTCPEAVELANVAAGLAVERLGCARISLSDLSYYLLKEHHTSKLFDSHHLFALKEALRQRSYHLVELKGTGHLTSSFITKLKEIKSQDELLLIHPETAQPHLVEHLACLDMIDGVLLGEGIASLQSEFPPNQTTSLNV
jgi:D-beta-D-heptose 7-phosphate kinase/D-beta-D-heptose 1-phosphate adenosyltransferase